MWKAICGRLTLFTLRPLIQARINPWSAKLDNLNFHSLKVVSRYRDPQLQVGENNSYLCNLYQNIGQSEKLIAHLLSNFSFEGKIK